MKRDFKLGRQFEVWVKEGMSDALRSHVVASMLRYAEQAVLDMPECSFQRLMANTIAYEERVIADSPGTRKALVASVRLEVTRTLAEKYGLEIYKSKKKALPGDAVLTNGCCYDIVSMEGDKPTVRSCSGGPAVPVVFKKFEFGVRNASGAVPNPEPLSFTIFYFR